MQIQPAERISLVKPYFFAGLGEVQVLVEESQAEDAQTLLKAMSNGEFENFEDEPTDDDL